MRSRVFNDPFSTIAEAPTPIACHRRVARSGRCQTLIRAKCWTLRIGGQFVATRSWMRSQDFGHAGAQIEPLRISWIP